MPTFRVQQDEEEATMHRIPKDFITLGRSEANDIVVQHTRASRRHAELRRVGKTWSLIDLGSRYGTLLNGMAVNMPSRLIDGDEITIGSVTLVFEPDEPAARRRTKADQIADDLYARVVDARASFFATVAEPFERGEVSGGAVQRLIARCHGEAGSYRGMARMFRLRQDRQYRRLLAFIRRHELDRRRNRR